MDIIWGSSQNWAIFFFKGQSTEWGGGIFLAAKISNIFGVLEIPDIFEGVKGRCWAPAYV